MGISIEYIPKNPQSLDDLMLQALGIDSLAQRGSYLIAQRLARLNGKTRFVYFRSVDGSHWMDICGGQVIPYQWDRRSSERKQRIFESLVESESRDLLHVVLQPAKGRIPVLEIKERIGAFRKFLTKYNKSLVGPQILMCKFEANCDFYVSKEAYLHGHVLIDARNAWAFRKAWAAFAASEGLPKVIAEIKIIPGCEIAKMVAYLAKHPIQVLIYGDKKYPLYHPRAMTEVEDGDLLDLQEAMHRTQFVWIPRKARTPKAESTPVAQESLKPTGSLIIRPSFNDDFVEWMTQFVNDFRHLQAHRGGISLSPADKKAFERQIERAYTNSNHNFKKWMPTGYLSEVGRVLVNWPP